MLRQASLRPRAKRRWDIDSEMRVWMAVWGSFIFFLKNKMVSYFLAKMIFCARSFSC